MGQPISSRTITTSKTGGLVLIQTPNGGGYITKLIPVTDLLAGVGNAALKLTNKTGNFNAPIMADTMVTAFFITIASGTPTVQIGTTSMGVEILDPTLISNNSPIANTTYFSGSGAIYFYVTGGAINVRIDLTYNYKA